MTDQENTGRLLGSLHRMISFAKKSRPFGEIPRAEFFAMNQVYHYQKQHSNEETGISVSKLGESLDMSNPAMSKLLRTMEQRGYILRTADENDRRVTIVKLSSQGEAMIEEGRKKTEERFSKAIGKMGEKDAEQLALLLDKMKNCLKDVMLEESQEKQKEVCKNEIDL